MPTTVPEPDVLLVLDHDLGDVEAGDVDPGDRVEAAFVILALVALIIRRILREDSERRRAELFAKLAAWLERAR